MRKNLFSRSWYYFRNGWGTYFAFIFAAINTLTVTYYLAIERYPVLKEIFPSFVQYVIVITIVGIPLLVFVGYIHYKKTTAYKSEAEIIYESNPFIRRVLVNTELLVLLNLQLLDTIAKLSNNEKLSQQEIDEILRLRKELTEFTEKRSFDNNIDLDYLKFMRRSK